MSKSKTPLYKRLKYGNICLAAVIVAFAVLMLYVVKTAASDPKEDASSASSDPLSSNTDSAGEPSESQTIVSGGVLGKNDFVYIKFAKSAVYDGALVLVSKDSSYSGSVPADCVSCYDYMFDEERNKLFSIKSSDVKVRTNALTSFNSLMGEFYKLFGKAELVLSEGYSAADPSSEFSAGNSFLVKLSNSDGSYSAFSPIGNYKYISDNCYKYGLIMRYPDEKSQITGVTGQSGVIRYVGMPHAQIMYKNNLCLEEYLELVRNYNYDNAIAYTTDGGDNYAVYFAPSEGEQTNIKIPTNSSGSPYPYEISGNNTDGYIVTVKLPD